MQKLTRYVLVFVLSPAISVLAAGNAAGEAVLLKEQSGALPWIVGVGILVGAVIVGFKHSGRTHLD